MFYHIFLRFLKNNVCELFPNFRLLVRQVGLQLSEKSELLVRARHPLQHEDVLVFSSDPLVLGVEVCAELSVIVVLVELAVFVKL